MTNKEAVNWLINITADIGKTEHRDLWHYEQALTEIKDMLESEQPEIMRAVRSMTLEQAIEHAEEVTNKCQNFVTAHKKDRELGFVQRTEKCANEHRQLAEWLKILKSAKFEYDEAWRIIMHPTPDVTSYDKDRAQVILDTFRDSLGRMEIVDD